MGKIDLTKLRPMEPHREWLSEQVTKATKELERVRKLRFRKTILAYVVMSFVFVLIAGNESGMATAIATSTAMIILGVYGIYLDGEARRENIRKAITELREAKKALSEDDEEES